MVINVHPGDGRAHQVMTRLAPQVTLMIGSGCRQAMDAWYSASAREATASKNLEQFPKGDPPYLPILAPPDPAPFP